MQFFADFHIHSHYSRATSRELTPEMLDYWASIKGLKVIGTGDFTHPGWLAELKEKLEPAEEGLYRLKSKYKIEANGIKDLEPRFILTAEISNIYKRDERVRKIHSLIFSPGFEAAERLQSSLESRDFNISSDGRPILGLDVRDLLELVLESSGESLFVPAHIWTPWFSLLGEKSGFDSVEECFGELSKHIYALETGLSSDPPMNWLLSSLDRYTLLSNSDAHSPDKLGRNANIFETELSYPTLMEAIKEGNGEHFKGTIDLYPEEGKYHFDGHRKCGVRFNPLETIGHEGLCPVCGERLTTGVVGRVAELSDRSDPLLNKRRAPFHQIIPLKEILAELMKSNESSKDVRESYFSLVRKGGPELEILLNMPLKKIEQIGNSSIAEAIGRMRESEVFVEEGYDGEYGRIRLFAPGEEPDESASLFAGLFESEPGRPERRPLINFDLDEYRKLKEESRPVEIETAPEKVESGPNKEQQEAIRHCSGPSLIVAGPGTGKTRTLVERISYLVKDQGADPAAILAVTFTNRAAGELKERLAGESGYDSSKLNIFTFHGLGYKILSESRSFRLYADEERSLILKRLGINRKNRSRLLEGISKVKEKLKDGSHLADERAAQLFKRYEKELENEEALDLDDLLYRTILLLKVDSELLESYRRHFRWIMIDEYQDINYSQYRLMKLLAPDSSSNITAIGDPDQAIYSFRGSDITYINHFLDDYKGAPIFKLKRSYRCSRQILKGAAMVLGNEPLEGLKEGVNIELSAHPTEKSEAEYIARTIEELLGGVSFFSMDSNVAGGHTKRGISGLSSFAVLCRIRAQMEPIKKALLDHHIPSRLIGERPFFKEGVSADLITLLQLSRDRENSLLKERVRESGLLPANETLFDELAGLDKVAASLERAAELSELKSAENLDELERLFRLAEPFKEDFSDFFRFITLGSSSDSYLSREERVNIMTIHAAKGLEFDAVFVAGCEDGLLPLTHFHKDSTDLEEERRLLYVAMTRARSYLYLSRAESRSLAGKRLKPGTSPFIEELEKSHEGPVKKKNRGKKKAHQEKTLF